MGLFATRYFYRSRHYGLHAWNTYERLASVLPRDVKQEGATVRTIIGILTLMLKEEPYRCPHCHSDRLEIVAVLADRNYVWNWLGSRSLPIKAREEEPGFTELEVDIEVAA
jgi:hypothetical protein